MIPIQILLLSQPSTMRRDIMRKKFFLIRKKERFQHGLVVTLAVVVVLVMIAVEIALSRKVKKSTWAMIQRANCSAMMILQSSKKCLT